MHFTRLQLPLLLCHNECTSGVLVTASTGSRPDISGFQVEHLPNESVWRIVTGPSLEGASADCVTKQPDSAASSCYDNAWLQMAVIAGTGQLSNPGTACSSSQLCRGLFSQQIQTRLYQQRQRSFDQP